TRAELQKPDGSGASAYYFEPVTAIRFNAAGGSDSLIVRRDGGAAAIPITTSGPAGQAVVTDDGGYQIIDGVLGGSGNQQRPSATVIDGILRVAGTDAADEMNVGISADGAHVFVRVNATEFTFDLAGITGVEMNGGAGND